MQNERRMLGLDVGDRRIGIAVSDFTGSLATPIETYRRRTPEQDVQYITRLAEENEASKIVVGLPKNMDGTEGEQAAKTRAFAGRLEHSAPVLFWDERLSTAEATRRLLEVGGRRSRDLRKSVDAEAAAVILESYLDHLRLGAR